MNNVITHNIAGSSAKHLGRIADDLRYRHQMPQTLTQINIKNDICGKYE